MTFECSITALLPPAPSRCPDQFTATDASFRPAAAASGGAAPLSARCERLPHVFLRVIDQADHGFARSVREPIANGVQHCPVKRRGPLLPPWGRQGQPEGDLQRLLDGLAKGVDQRIVRRGEDQLVELEIRLKVTFRIIAGLDHVAKARFERGQGLFADAARRHFCDHRLHDPAQPEKLPHEMVRRRNGALPAQDGRVQPAPRLRIAHPRAQPGFRFE